MPIRHAALLFACVVAAILVAVGAMAAEQSDADARAEAALADGNQQGDSAETPQVGESDAAESINMLDLLFAGGWLMLPIVLMSVLVVALGIERAIALRRSRILPEELVAALGRLSSNTASFDPQRVYRLCQEFPSSAATIIRSMLLKLGRPHQEVETTVHEAVQREAGRLYTNVRTLNLAAGVSPLLGLLGTVWGMIQAFFVTANMPVAANKAEALAGGIYVALVTTFAGLAVAIPAAVLAHIFEGRIEASLRRVEELLSSLLPQVERYEGTVRMRPDQLERTSGDGAAKQQQQQPSATMTVNS